MTAGLAREDKTARGRGRWRFFVAKPASTRPILLRYGVALGAVVLATVASNALAPHSYRTPFLLYYPAVVFAVWFGGFGPGVLTTLLASLAANYYALPPHDRLNLDLPGVLQTAFFALTFTSICWFVDLARQQLYSVIDIQSQRLRATFDHAGVGILEADAEDRMIAANDRAAEILGRSREELIGKTLYELTAAEDRERAIELNRALRRGQRERLVWENRFLKPNGSLLWSHLTVSAIRDSKGRFLRSIATLEDITERKQAEAELRRSEEQNRLLFANMLQGVVYHDSTGSVISLNPAAERILGFGAEEIAGMTSGILENRTIHEDGTPFPVTEHPSMMALRTGEQVRDVVMGVYNPREQGYRWINVNAVPLFRPGEGGAYQVYTVFEDITERRRAEEALIRSEKLASVGRMAATIAHEINNPLAAVMNSLFIASSLDISPTAREYLEIADAELKRIAHLTKQALGFYRESASPELVEVSEVVDSAVDLMKSKIKLKQVSVQKEYARAAPIMAVTGELRQVFANLFANSLDAIEPRGKIRVRVSACTHSRNGTRCVRITVADNGKGIPPEVLPHIFEPLYTTKTSVGTGLGLWVGRQLVEKHGGLIRVHSRVGGKYRGSAFSVLLPAEGMPTEKTASAPLGL